MTKTKAKAKAKIKAAKTNVAEKHTGELKAPSTFNALKVTQSANNLYLFTASASLLFAMLSINRRAEDKDEGYQRVLSVRAFDQLRTI